MDLPKDAAVFNVDDLETNPQHVPYTSPIDSGVDGPAADPSISPAGTGSATAAPMH
jgi:hypothetical protein